MTIKQLEKLGEPDIQIAQLRIWIHGRQFPEAADYWDGNWLNVTACCIGDGSSVRAQGSIIHLGEIVGLLGDCETLYESLSGRAELKCIEPNLNVRLESESGGHIGVTIDITADHMSESHQFIDGMDQTYLPPIISACRNVLERFPLRDADGRIL